MASLSVRNVRKRFGPVEVLHGIDFEVADGEFLILVGPSGCGKSTLLSMIAGLDGISQGEIAIAGQLVNHLGPKDRDIAMVFQSYALYPSMTVRQNIEFALQLRKVPKAERDAVVARVAKTLQMEALLQRRPAQLSGGQRQRVAMGRALTRDPAVFLFDEPLSNLDAKLRVEMRADGGQWLAELRTACGNAWVPVARQGPPRPGIDSPLAGQALVLGLRPEHLREAQPGQAGAFEVEIALLEPTGADTFGFADINGRRAAPRCACRPNAYAKPESGCGWWSMSPPPACSTRPPSAASAAETGRRAVVLRLLPDSNFPTCP